MHTLVLVKQTQTLRLLARKSMSALAVLATLGASSFIALPQANADEVFTYMVNVDGSATVTGCVSTCPAQLVIPSKLDDRSVTAVKAWSFAGKSLTSLTIPDSVTAIGIGAFGSNLLTTVALPPALTLISEKAFYNNELQSIAIPPSVTTVQTSAFLGNKLSTLTIPATITDLGDSVFAWNRLTSVVVAGNCPTVGADLFNSNPALKSVTVAFIAENCGDTLSGTVVNRLDPVGKPATAPRVRWVIPGDSQVRMRVWGPSKNGGAAIIRYEYSIDAGSTWLAVDESPSEPVLVIKGLENGTSYDIQLRAFTGAGGGAASNARTVTPRTKSDAPVITALTGLSAKIRVEFNEPVSNGGAPIQRYAFSVNGGSWYTWGAKNVNTTQYIRGLKPRVECTIRIRAYTAAGWGAISEEVTGKATR